MGEKTKIIDLRFYEELNDFLAAEKRKITFSHGFINNPTIKDIIESLGVPHTEIDLILVNGISVDFHYQPKDGDQISVYPNFESIDITPLTRLRPAPLRETKFVLDVHLGKLAKYLRLLGFDTLYQNSYSDIEIVHIAQNEHRIILTRDIGLLKNKSITHGYWLRNTAVKKQMIEVLHRFDLVRQVKPFSRCLECNSTLAIVDKTSIADKLPAKTLKYYNEFHQCTHCGKIYWQGSHYKKMQRWLAEVLSF